MLREPRKLVLDFRTGTSPDTLWRGLLGNGYVQQMRASPLVERLRRVRSDLESGEDTLDRKLRYLLWLN